MPRKITHWCGHHGHHGTRYTTGLDTLSALPTHAPDQTAYRDLVDAVPLLPQGCCEDLYCHWWVLMPGNMSLEDVPQMINRIEVCESRWPLHDIDAFLLQVGLDDSGRVRSGIVVHQKYPDLKPQQRVVQPVEGPHPFTAQLLAHLHQ